MNNLVNYFSSFSELFGKIIETFESNDKLRDESKRSEFSVKLREELERRRERYQQKIDDKFHHDHLIEQMEKVNLELKIATDQEQERIRKESETIKSIQAERDKLNEEIRSHDQKMAERQRELDQLEAQRSARESARGNDCIIL